MAASDDRRAAGTLRAGAAAGIPIAIGYVPIAVAYGALSVKSGVPLGQTCLMSMLVFAGASQFMAVSMWAGGAGAAQIVIATFILNLRQLIMSMALATRLRGWEAGERLAASLGITDETFALLSVRFPPGQAPSRRFVAGLMLGAYLSWVLGSAAGALFAAAIPASLGSGLSVALYAMFIVLLVPAVRHAWRAGLTAALAMALSLALHRVLPAGWAIICATVIAAATNVVWPDGREAVA